MSLFDRFADAVIERALLTPYTSIRDDDDQNIVYMERFWLREYDKHNILPAARVHHILRSDSDGATHDHPWNYWTLILRGGYIEHTPQYDESGLYIGEHTETYVAGDLLHRRYTDWHWLEIPPGMDTWTLFMTGKFRQKWGYLTQPAFKTYWREHRRAIGKPVQKIGSENYHERKR